MLDTLTLEMKEELLEYLKADIASIKAAPPKTYLEKQWAEIKAHHSKRQESLAEYYYRINHHLLGKVKIAEYDPESFDLKVLNNYYKGC